MLFHNYCRSTSDNRLCCLLRYNLTIECIKTSPTSPLETCGSLYPGTTLRIFAWIMGLSALLGNAAVILARFRMKKSTNAGTEVQNKMIISLAFADFLMGIYMIIITSADIFFGDQYYLQAPQWRESPLCSFAGFLGLLSSESSVLTLVLITLDRFICIVFPFTTHKIGPKSSNVFIISIWVLSSLFLGIFPLIMGSDVYGLTDVCMRLPWHVETDFSVVQNLFSGFHSRYAGVSGIEEFVPQTTNTNPSDSPWWFSIAIFMYVNLLACVFIVVCYVAIFITVVRSSASVRRSMSSSSKREIRVAGKMALFIVTDLACWMPVIIMGFLSQTGSVGLHPSLYAWTIILIIPINSSINPIIYTFLIFLESRIKQANKAKSRCRERQNQNQNIAMQQMN